MRSIAMLLAGSATLASMALFSPDDAAGAAAPETAKKSIVPQGWKSKGDELSQFIDAQATGKEGFEYTAFFALCRKNIAGTLTEDKIAHYENLVNEKAHGSQGRAKMTLRNMLATIARKNGKLIGLDGEEVAINLPKPAVSGAAAKAQEAAAEKTEQTADEPAGTVGGAQIVGDDEVSGEDAATE